MAIVQEAQGISLAARDGAHEQDVIGCTVSSPLHDVCRMNDPSRGVDARTRHFVSVGESQRGDRSKRLAHT